MILRSLVAAVLATSAVPDAHPPGFPSVRILERTVLYPIRGDSVREIRSQLEHHGPWPAGEGQGRTDGAFEVGTELEPGADGCRLAGLELGVQITTTLPQWQPGPRGRSCCRRTGRSRSSSWSGMRAGTGCMPSKPPTSCTISCFGSRRRTAACASSARPMTRCGACHRPCACGAGTTTSGPATGCASPRRSRIASRAHPPMGTSGQANSNAPQANEAVKPCTSG